MGLSLAQSDQNLSFEFDLLSECFRLRFDLTDLELSASLTLKSCNWLVLACSVKGIFAAIGLPVRFWTLHTYINKVY